MDLLEQYKQQNPGAFREQRPVMLATDPYGREYGLFVRLAMRASGGRIQDVRQANMALLAVAVIIATVSALIFFNPASLFRQSAKEIYYPPPAL